MDDYYSQHGNHVFYQRQPHLVAYLCQQEAGNSIAH
jgi:hypothetical protein